MLAHCRVGRRQIVDRGRDASFGVDNFGEVINLVVLVLGFPRWSKVKVGFFSQIALEVVLVRDRIPFGVGEALQSIQFIVVVAGGVSTGVANTLVDFSKRKV